MTHATTTDHPVLVGTLSADGRTVRVWCPYCRRDHLHGASGLGHRVAHCTGDTPNMAP